MQISMISINKIDSNNELAICLRRQDGTAIAPGDTDWDGEVDSLSHELPEALKRAVSDYGGSVRRGYHRGGPVQPGFGEAHDLILPAIYAISVSLTSAGALSALAKALTAYFRERRSDLRIEVGDIVIDAKRIKEPEEFTQKTIAAIREIYPVENHSRLGRRAPRRGIGG